MLACEQVKVIENAFGEEKAAPILEAFQTSDARVMSALLAEVATKVDLARLEMTTKADLARLEMTTKVDLAKLEKAMVSGLGNLETRFEARMGSIEARLARLDVMLKVLIGLTALAVAFFSPVADKLLSLLLK